MFVYLGITLKYSGMSDLLPTIETPPVSGDNLFFLHGYYHMPLPEGGLDITCALLGTCGPDLGNEIHLQNGFHHLTPKGYKSRKAVVIDAGLITTTMVLNGETLGFISGETAGRLMADFGKAYKVWERNPGYYEGDEGRPAGGQNMNHDLCPELGIRHKAWRGGLTRTSQSIDKAQ